MCCATLLHAPSIIRLLSHLDVQAQHCDYLAWINYCMYTACWYRTASTVPGTGRPGLRFRWQRSAWSWPRVGLQFARSSNKASVAVWVGSREEIVEALPSDPPHVEIISTRNSQDNTCVLNNRLFYSFLALGCWKAKKKHPNSTTKPNWVLKTKKTHDLHILRSESNGHNNHNPILQIWSIK